MLATRLHNQKLVATNLLQPEDIVSWLGAVQAQDYIGAKWALGLRATDLTDAAIEQAFAAGRILRTHLLRPTWHFVTPSDIRWLLALTGPRVQAVNRGYGRRLGLDDRVFTRARIVIERALEGGNHLTRKEIAAALRRARITVDGQQLAHLVGDVELQAAICSGPRRGKQFTYALVAERAPHARVLSRDEALAELTRRYFQSHGPATMRDFSWWSGLTMKDVRAGTAMTRVEVLASAPQPDSVRGANYLLPNYDEYLIAYKDRNAVIDPARARNLAVFTNLEYPHHVIVDGRVAGSWRRTITSTSLAVEISGFEKLKRGQAHALTAQAKKYGRFLQLDCDVASQSPFG